MLSRPGADGLCRDEHGGPSDGLIFAGNLVLDIAGREGDDAIPGSSVGDSSLGGAEESDAGA